MGNVTLSFPTFGFVVATRAALGAGVGLLISRRLSRRNRQRAGLALVVLGAATTVPAAMAVFRSRKAPTT